MCLSSRALFVAVARGARVLVVSSPATGSLQIVLGSGPGPIAASRHCVLFIGSSVAQLVSWCFLMCFEFTFWLYAVAA